MRDPDWSTSHFKDRVDPSDEDFRLVEIRLPRDRVAFPAWGPFEYLGAAARERVRRFCAVFLSVYGDITKAEAKRIVERSHAVDARRQS